MTTEDTGDVLPTGAAGDATTRRPYLRVVSAVFLLGVGLFIAVALLAEHYVNYGRWAYQGSYPILWGANLHKMGDRQRAIIFSDCGEPGLGGTRKARFDVRHYFPPRDAVTDSDHERSARMTALALLVPCLLTALAFFIWRKRFSLRTLLMFAVLVGFMSSLPLLIDRRDFEYGTVECQIAYPECGFRLDKGKLLVSLAPDRVAARTPPWLLAQLSDDGQFAVAAIRWAPDRSRRHLTFDNDAVLELHFRPGTDTPTRERCLEWYASFLGLVMAEAFRQQGYEYVSGRVDFELNLRPFITRAQKGWAPDRLGPGRFGRAFGPGEPLFEFRDQPAAQPQ